MPSTLDWTDAICRTDEHRAKFHNPALDYDADSEDFQDLSTAEHAAMAAERIQAESICVDACLDCPLMVACGKWAVENAVAGVAGGYTEQERRAIRDAKGIQVRAGLSSAEMLLGTRGPRNQVDDGVVAQLTDQGMDARTIAYRLNCAERTVVRSRDRIRRGTASHQAAATRTNCPGVSTTPATAATVDPDVYPTDLPAPRSAVTTRSTFHPSMQTIFDCLADGAWHDREELLTKGVLFVTDDEAKAWWFQINSKKVAGSDERVLNPAKADTPEATQISVGARDKVMNSLSASHRTQRRTLRGGPDGTDSNLFRLHPQVREQWLALADTTIVTTVTSDRIGVGVAS